MPKHRSKPECLWQVHTVRAAISGLRMKGFEVTRTKSKKSGETVYAIVSGRSAEVEVELPKASFAEVV